MFITEHAVIAVHVILLNRSYLWVYRLTTP